MISIRQGNWKKILEDVDKIKEGQVARKEGRTEGRREGGSEQGGK